MNKRLSQSAAFTLIELLVVISIVALLIALLLPALKSARQTARTMHGLSNQRQIMMAVVAYSADYDNSFPRGKLDATPWWDWSVMVNGHMDGRTPSFGGISKIFRDPNSTFSQGRLHYSAHPVIMPDSFFNGGVPMQFDHIGRATEVFAIVDGTQASAGPVGLVKERASSVNCVGYSIFKNFNQVSGNADRPIQIGSNRDAGSSGSGHIRYRQGGGSAVNMAYVDGHAATVPMGGVLERNVLVDR